MHKVIDFHSHILPRVDDGSASSEESIAMLRMEAEQGIGHVVMTPHFYPQHDTPQRFLERRNAAAERLQQVMGEQNGLPEIHLGAEVYYFRGISESDILKQLTFGEKGCILIEMPFSPWSEQMYQDLADISGKQGLTPVIAHIDRYIAPFHTHGIPERLAQLPVAVQANAEFFLHRATRGMALRMLKKGQIHLLGSDCHNLKDRAPNLGEAIRVIEKRAGAEAIHRICQNQRELFMENEI